MSKKEVSYDGEFSKNLFFKNSNEKDLIEIKGYEEWKSYRDSWESCCKLETELNFPIHMEIELNYSCNLRCPMCTWSAETMVEKKEDWFKFEDFKRIMDEAVTKGTKAVRFTYINEPLIRRDIDQFVKYASDIGILDIIITSNGTLLDKEMSQNLISAGLTKLNISLDAFTEETYNKIRVGGNLKKTISNIKNFLELREKLNKKIPKLFLSFVRTTINDNECHNFIEYWKDKVDGFILQNPSNPFAEGKFKDPVKKNLFMPKNWSTPENFRCPEPFKRMTLRSNGDVLGCCSFYAVDLVVGNWKKKSIEEIWNGEKMKKLRSNHKEGKPFENPVCKNCIENVAFLTD